MINYAQILEISLSTLNKPDLSTARMYVGCDDISSIPNEINVIIGSKSYRAIIRIEIKIIEPPEVTVTQERRDWVEKNLEGSPEPNRSTVGGAPISESVENRGGDRRDS